RKTIFMKSLWRVFFPLPLPGSLRGYRRGILRYLALILYAFWRIDHNLCEFIVLSQPTQVVSPQPSLRLEMQGLSEAILQVCFFAVDIRRQPQAGPQV